MKKEKLKILYEDKYLIAVDKKSNLLTISTNKESINTLYHQVHEYLFKKKEKVFIIHRLDKDTSGIVLFAKSDNIKKIMQDNWDNVKRKYIALVHGNVKKSGVVKSYLKETKTLYVYSSNDKKNGKYAETYYDVIKNNMHYSLLDIDIKTGRKNQIRVHLNDINHPIVGDKKYGTFKDKEKRMYLDAYKLEFIHPVTKEKIVIEKDTKELLNVYEKNI